MERCKMLNRLCCKICTLLRRLCDNINAIYQFAFCCTSGPDLIDPAADATSPPMPSITLSSHHNLNPSTTSAEHVQHLLHPLHLQFRFPLLIFES